MLSDDSTILHILEANPFFSTSVSTVVDVLILGDGLSQSGRLPI